MTLALPAAAGLAVAVTLASSTRGRAFGLGYIAGVVKAALMGGLGAAVPLVAAFVAEAAGR